MFSSLIQTVKSDLNDNVCELVLNIMFYYFLFPLILKNILLLRIWIMHLIHIYSIVVNVHDILGNVCMLVHATINLIHH